MATIAWLLDIGGFVLFIFTNTMDDWMMALGLVIAGFCVAQYGLSNPGDPDLDGDGEISQEEALTFFQKVGGLASARSGAVTSAVIIGIWMLVAS